MPGAPNPAEIFEKAADDGKRRLDQGLWALLATGFIAGFTIVLGAAAQALVHSAALPHFGEFASVLGAFGFAIGVVFLIIGRAELFSENFFDPIATAFEGKEQNVPRRLARLWVFTFALNIVGGIMLILVFSVEGVLNANARQSIATLALELAERNFWTTVASSIVGGALVALLSFLVIAAGNAGTRAAMAFAVGVMLALGPFEHVVVSVLHLLFGLFIGIDLTVQQFARIGVASLAGNLLGGIGLVTLSHAAQALSEQDG